MKTACRQFTEIASLTAVQELRQPILLLITMAGGTTVMLLPVLIAHQFGEDGKLVRDSGLALYFVFGLPFCVFAADTLRRERANGTAAMTLSKAVRPEVFFLAKYAGIALLTIGYALCMTAAILLADRIAPRANLTDLRLYRILLVLMTSSLIGAGAWNLLTRRSFCAAAATAWLLALGVAVLIATGIDGAVDSGLTFNRPLQWRIVPATLLIGAALLIFAAIAGGLSTYLKPAPSVALCFGLLLIGLLSDYAFGRFSAESPWAAFAYHMVPNWQHFWTADWLAAGGRIPSELMRNVLIYATLYGSGILALGVACWRHTEIG